MKADLAKNLENQKLFYLNARSLKSRTKSDLFYSEILCNYDFPKIIAVTETHLNPLENLNSQFMGNEQYEIFRTDRVGRDGGGVALFVSTDLNSFLVNSSIIGVTETIWVMTMFGPTKVLFGVVYRPPGTTAEVSKQVTDEIRETISKYPGAIPILMGDFNYPGIDWITETSSLGGSEQARSESYFLGEMQSHGMIQHTLSPTNGLNVLDLIFTNEPSLITSVNHHPPLGLADHDVLEISIQLPNLQNEQEVRYRTAWESADYDAITLGLEATDWAHVFSSCAKVEDFWQSFRNVLDDLISSHVPKKPVRSGPKRPSPKHLRKLQLAKRKAYAAKKRSPRCPQKCQNYKNASKNLREAIRKESFAQEKRFLRPHP